MNELNIKYQKVSEWHQLGKPCSTLQQRRVQWAQYQQDLQNIITPPQCKQEWGSCSSGWQPIGVSANLTDNWLRESDVIKEWGDRKLKGCPGRKGVCVYVRAYVYL